MRFALALLAATALFALAACGGGSSSEETTAAPATSAADTGAATGEAGEPPCTKDALAEGARPSFDTEVKILDGYVCEDGWAAGPILAGPSGSEEQIEAAFLVKAENGKWVVPAKLPCDDSDVPEKVLDVSPCRVS